MTGFEYAVLFARRWRYVVTVTVITVLAAAGTLALRPGAYRAEVLIHASTSTLAERAQSWLDVGAMPATLLVGVTRVETQRRGELLRLTVTATSVEHAQTAPLALVAWLRATVTPVPVVDPAWRDELTRVERRLATAPLRLTPYWTARGLGLVDQTRSLTHAAGTLTRVERPVVAHRLPRPWAFTLLSAALSGLVLVGLLPVLLQEAWRRWLVEQAPTRPAQSPWPPAPAPSMSEPDYGLSRRL